MFHTKSMEHWNPPTHNLPSAFRLRSNLITILLPSCRWRQHGKRNHHGTDWGSFPPMRLEVAFCFCSELFVHVPFSRNMSQQPRIPEHLSAEKSRPFLSIVWLKFIKIPNLHAEIKSAKPPNPKISIIQTHFSLPVEQIHKNARSSTIIILVERGTTSQKITIFFDHHHVANQAIKYTLPTPSPQKIMEVKHVKNGALQVTTILHFTLRGWWGKE